MFFNGISMHFDENRTLATQIGTLGASIGQFALPVFITASITGYSLQATVTKKILLTKCHDNFETMKGIFSDFRWYIFESSPCPALIYGSN